MKHSTKEKILRIVKRLLSYKEAATILPRTPIIKVGECDILPVMARVDIDNKIIPSEPKAASNYEVYIKRALCKSIGEYIYSKNLATFYTSHPFSPLSESETTTIEAKVNLSVHKQS